MQVALFEQLLTFKAVKIRTTMRIIVQPHAISFQSQTLKFLHIVLTLPENMDGLPGLSSSDFPIPNMESNLLIPFFLAGVDFSGIKLDEDLSNVGRRVKDSLGFDSERGLDSFWLSIFPGGVGMPGKAPDIIANSGGSPMLFNSFSISAGDGRGAWPGIWGRESVFDGFTIWNGSNHGNRGKKAATAVIGSIPKTETNKTNHTTKK